MFGKASNWNKITNDHSEQNKYLIQLLSQSVQWERVAIAVDNVHPEGL